MRRVAKWLLVAVAAPGGLGVAIVAAAAFVQPPLTALMVWRLAGGAGIDHRPVPLESISPHLRHAVLTSEDNRFCAHHGVDWVAVDEALDELADGGEPRGASTITMQIAKNLLFWPDRSYLRKALEVPFAYLIDALWSKRHILEVYLNIAEWGPGIYGAEAAARHHFARAAVDLTARQSAQLAAALPAPLVRSAGRPGPVTRRVAARILGRMDQTHGLFACVES
jgi:monofunctional biosynthetic peptidoglycan transglycosylase